ncbi:MAG: endonuclease III [Firmicutes bacterium]|nr:endonuclease III [Bacillota bacterium]
MGKGYFDDRQIVEILDRLRKAHPDAGCALDHRDVFELTVCVVLSAQTTDVSVNKVSPALFEKYPDAKALASASQDDVMEIIKTIGMYKTKSRNIINLAKALCELYDGQVPGDFESLIKLPGVGRKTANVVLAEGFGHQKIAVDTHVFRVSHRIGLAGNKDESQAEAGDDVSAKTAGAKEVLLAEEELMDVLPEDRWTEAHHTLIFHGRRCCTARNPKCGECVLSDMCAYLQK